MPSGGVSLDGNIRNKQRVYWDGANGPILEGYCLCYSDTNTDGATVTRPATANLGAFAGVYDGEKGSLNTAGWIDIHVPGSGAQCKVITDNADSAGVGKAIRITNGSFTATQDATPAIANAIVGKIVRDSDGASTEQWCRLIDWMEGLATT